MGYYDFYNRKNIKSWLNNHERTKGTNQKNVEYLRELKQLKKDLSRNNTINFFLLSKLGVQNCRTMMMSGKKQKDFVYAAIQDLKKYKVEKEWEKPLSMDIQMIRKRVDYVFFIIKENLRMTEYYPFFMEQGFDLLTTFENNYYEGSEVTALDHLLPIIEQWNREHKKEIEEHLESVREEKEATERHKKEVAEKEKQEKEALKAKKKAEKEELQLIRKNEKAYLSRKRRIDKSFERYFK